MDTEDDEWLAQARAILAASSAVQAEYEAEWGDFGWYPEDDGTEEHPGVVMYFEDDAYELATELHRLASSDPRVLVGVTRLVFDAAHAVLPAMLDYAEVVVVARCCDPLVDRPLMNGLTMDPDGTEPAGLHSLCGHMVVLPLGAGPPCSIEALTVVHEVAHLAADVANGDDCGHDYRFAGWYGRILSEMVRRDDLTAVADLVEGRSRPRRPRRTTECPPGSNMLRLVVSMAEGQPFHIGDGGVLRVLQVDAVNVPETMPDRPIIALTP